MSDLGGRRTEGGGRIDLAIDRAIRDMLDVEQPSGLRGRVLARIENRGPVVSGFSGKIFWVGAPLAAAAVVILALLLPRQQVQPKPAAPITVARVQPPSSQLAPEAGSSKPEAGSQQLVAGSRQLEAGNREPQAGSRKLGAASDGLVAAATTDPGGRTIEIEPLRRIVPIEFAPLSQSSIAPADIAVRPLNTISELQIAPLNPPDRRN